MNFRMAGVTNVQASVRKIPEETSERMAHMRVENGVSVIGVHVEDLIDRGETSGENEASEYRHEEGCSRVQGMSDDEGEFQCDDEEEEGRAAKPARNPGAPTTAEISKHAVSHWPHRSQYSH